jgi:hypothetical protein
LAYSVGDADASSEVDAVAEVDCSAEVDGSSEADAPSEADPEEVGAAEVDGKRLKLAFGDPDGSGKRELGKPRNASKNIRTKMATTASTHGRAIVSLRVGRAPR